MYLLFCLILPAYTKSLRVKHTSQQHHDGLRARAQKIFHTVTARTLVRTGHPKYSARASNMLWDRKRKQGRLLKSQRTCRYHSKNIRHSEVNTTRSYLPRAKHENARPSIPRVCLTTRNSKSGTRSVSSHASTQKRRRTRTDHRSSLPCPHKSNPKNSGKPHRIFMGGSLSFSLIVSCRKSKKGTKENRSRSCSMRCRTDLDMPQSDGDSISSWPMPRRWEKPGW